MLSNILVLKSKSILFQILQLNGNAKDAQTNENTS